MKKISCIIPFYNESLKPVHVVEAVTKLKSLSQIIAVDDGSENQSTNKKLLQKFPDIIIRRISVNKGKAFAVRLGLTFVKGDYVLLLDGDLIDINIQELAEAIKKIIKYPEIDMIILRRVADKTAAIIPWLRDDIVLSGQRILKTKDLRKVFSKKIEGYRLETEINSYMMENNKKVFWMPFSVQNIHKQHKWGYWEGLKIGIHGFIRYMFSVDMVRQILYFCKEEVK